MRSILVVTDAADASVLSGTLQRLGHHIVGEVAQCGALKECVEKLRPDVIVVSTDEPGAKLFENLDCIAQSCPKPVVMFAKDPRSETIRKSVACGVSAYVVDGWSHERVTAIIEAAIARFEAYSAVKKELAQTRAKLSERKIVEKAKGIVMQQRGLTEEQAYSSLRKMAMDQSLPLAEVARRVIAVSQLLA
jgi:two-component system, response regulator / RNA-binding antiterminator